MEKKPVEEICKKSWFPFEQILFCFILIFGKDYTLYLEKKKLWSIFILKYLSYITTISNCNYYCNCISNWRVSQFDLEWQNKAMYTYSHKYHFDFDANYRYIIQQFYPCTWQSSCYVSPLKVKERFLLIQMWLHWTILKVVLACIEQTSGRIIKCSLSPITK